MTFGAVCSLVMPSHKGPDALLDAGLRRRGARAAAAHCMRRARAGAARYCARLAEPLCRGGRRVVTQSREDCRQLDEGGGPASNSEMHQARRRPGARAPHCVSHPTLVICWQTHSTTICLMRGARRFDRLSGGLHQDGCKGGAMPRAAPSDHTRGPRSSHSGRPVCPAYQSAFVRLCAAVAALVSIPAPAPGCMRSAALP